MIPPSVIDAVVTCEMLKNRKQLQKQQCSLPGHFNFTLLKHTQLVWTGGHAEIPPKTPIIFFEN